MLLFSNLSMGQLAGSPMEYDEEDNGAAGSIPEFGAIFMASTVTKRECFKSGIFALPSSKAEFVKHVTTGMVLFLFEFEKRQLYGVYQASSDGAMDILPYAFNFSGRHYPAQVCFTPIWHCNPIPEREFRDAIRENYFSPKKFNFGLTEDQVHRLLSLFSLRKLKNKLPPRLPTETVVKDAGNNRVLVSEDSSELPERKYMESREHNEMNSSVLCDWQRNMSRSDRYDLLKEDGVGAERELSALGHGLSPDYHENFLEKRRKLDGNDRLMMNYVAENGIHNDHDALQSLGIDPPNDFLDEGGRLADGRRLLNVERACGGNHVEKSNGFSSDYPMRPFDVGTNKIPQSNRLLSEYEMNSGLGETSSREYLGKPFDKSNHTSSDDRFLFHDCVLREQDDHDIVKPVGWGDGNVNLLAPAREVRGQNQNSTIHKLESRYHLNFDGTPFGALDYSGSLLHKIKKETTGGRRLPISDRIERGPNFGSSVGGFSSENFARSLYHENMTNYDAKFQPLDGRVNENGMDSILCSADLNKNTGYVATADGQLVDHGRSRNSERLENLEDIHTHVNPAISADHPYLSKPKQNFLSFSDERLAETGCSDAAAALNFDSSSSKFGDATITRAVPCMAELSDFRHVCSTTFAADRNSSLVRQAHPYHSSLGHYYSLSSSRSPQHLKSSRSPDITPECGNKCSQLNTSSHQSSLHRVPTGFILNPNLSMPSELNAFAPVNYRGSSYSNLSLTSTRSSDREISEREKGLMFAYPSKSNENHFTPDVCLPIASQGMSRNVTRQEMDMLVGRDNVSSEANSFKIGDHLLERDLAGNVNQYFRISNHNLDRHREISDASLDPSTNRRSVFSRLASRQEVSVGEDENITHFNCHDSFMDASADEVMEMLHQVNNLPLRKLRKFKKVGQPKHRESDLNEKLIQSRKEVNHSTMVIRGSHQMEEDKQKDASQSIAECVGEVLSETRIVNFKRRSETKKNLVRPHTDSVADDKITVDEDVENSTRKHLKRRKLVRPVLGSTRSVNEDIGIKRSLQLPSQILDKDDKQSCEISLSDCEANISNDALRSCNELASDNPQFTGCDIKEHSYSIEQKDIVPCAVIDSHKLNELETLNVVLETDSSQVLKETTPCESSAVQTSIEGNLPKDTDETICCLNHEELSSEKCTFVADGNSLKEEKRSRILKRKIKTIRTSKPGMGCPQ